MYLLYNFFIAVVVFLLKTFSFLNPKLKKAVHGRKDSFSAIKKLQNEDSIIWMHCASLGEFEQGRPVIERLKEASKDVKILITFFSPSGYEVQKNYPLADVVCYLPFDTYRTISDFVERINPRLVFIVKYEFWPNFLKVLKEKNCPTLLISGVFTRNQHFFKAWGSWQRTWLQTFTHFFLQDENSCKLINGIDFKNTTLSGDTRFDRVHQISQQKKQLFKIEEFAGSHPVIVAGSTWKKDEALWMSYINSYHGNEKFIIVPHQITKEGIQFLLDGLSKKTALYSELESKNPSEFQVLIIDTIGILSQLYAYASIAYVGGGFTKSGVHNTLEAAVYGIPIIIGPHYSKYREVVAMIQLKCCFSISDLESLSKVLSKINADESKKAEIGKQAKKYIHQHIKATDKIVDFSLNLLEDTL